MIWDCLEIMFKEKRDAYLRISYSMLQIVVFRINLRPFH